MFKKMKKKPYIYLRFMPFLHIDLTQVVDILP